MTVEAVGFEERLTDTAEAFTVCVSLAGLLELKFGSVDVKVAVTTCLPAEVKVKGQAGTTPPVLIDTEHKVVAGRVVSKKTTVPEEGTAVPGFCAVSVARKLTDWLTVEGLGEDVTAIVVPEG